MGKNYWYSIDKWAIDLKNRKCRIEALAFYDLNKKLICSDNYIPDWEDIIPETYADGYYKVFFYLFEYKN